MEAGPSRSNFVCEECSKVCKSAKGLLQHKEIHKADYVDLRRPRGSKRDLQTHKKTEKRKPKDQASAQPMTKEKVTIVVEDPAPDDAQFTANLPSPGGIKKVTVLHEQMVESGDNDSSLEVKENIISFEEMYCDKTDISEFSYNTGAEDVGVADCSLLDDVETTATVLAEADTSEEVIIHNVVHDVFTPFEEEEEIILVIDESVEYLFTDYEDLESDFLLVTSSAPEEEWSEEPIPFDNAFLSSMSLTDTLVANLQKTIPEQWIIVSCKNGVRLSLLSHFENVSVLQSVSWTRDTDFKIFVHNREVLKTNFVWNSVAEMSEIVCEDIDVISEYLSKLCHVVQSSQICKGVRLFNDFWKKEERGYIENECYQEVACFRDKECPLLVPGTGTCVPCKKLLNILKCKNWRVSQEKEGQEKGKDKLKVNIKYLTGEEAKQRLRETQEKKRSLEKKIFKMREQLSKYIEKNSIPVTSEFGLEMAQIFNDNQNIVTPVQKLFWSEQLKCLAKQKNPKQIRWNPFIIRIALHLQMISSSAYDYIGNFIQLPSKRTLYDYSHVFESREGPQEQIMLDLSESSKNTCTENHEKYFNLIFDEVDIRSGIVLSRRSGEIVGYVNLSAVEEEIIAVEAEISEKAEPTKQIAKKLLVYMALGITNSLSGIVAAFTTAGNFSAGQIYTRTWNVIYTLENLGIKVICLTCDGASTNKKFFKMHANLDPSSKYIHKTNNIACGEDRPLYFITDPVHVLKSLRNNFSNSYSHKKTREMWNNGESLSWSVIETLFYLTKKYKIQDLKLTKAHIKLTSHSCMKVIFAAQVMSLTVVRAIDYCEEELKSKNLSVKEVQKFIKLVNDWFDCLNGSSDPKGRRIKENDNLRPYTDENDDRFTFMTEEFLKYFDEWLINVKNRPGKFSKEKREKMFISMLTYESLHTVTLGFIGVVKFLLAEGAPKVDARKINQDKLEQFFGIMRMSFGGNRCPDTLQALTMINTAHQAAGAAAPPSKGNTEAAHEWVPDESPLLKRPRHK
ncbi:Transposable element P transposase [Frankliniella fusca]|uniref:Transposable element P transposase n=1 Tax=Frankliniella fusca TaxID=407009 RepID=A0AAE1I1I3_9NEOP|nr:Transposable element P transposase [Frankliniella fusca]